jgi:hypothetical protein
MPVRKEIFSSPQVIGLAMMKMTAHSGRVSNSGIFFVIRRMVCNQRIFSVYDDKTVLYLYQRNLYVSQQILYIGQTVGGNDAVI